MGGVNLSPTVVPFFLDYCLFDKIKKINGTSKACSLLTAVCKTFLNVFEWGGLPTHFVFVELQDTLSWCKYAPFLFLFHMYAFLIEWMTFFFLEISVSFLVVFWNVTVACFSASFNVLTGILLQLKQLYFTSLVLCLLCFKGDLLCLLGFSLSHMHVKGLQSDKAQCWGQIKRVSLSLITPPELPEKSGLTPPLFPLYNMMSQCGHTPPRLHKTAC